MSNNISTPFNDDSSQNNSPRAYNKLDHSLIAELYYDNKLNCRQIADKLGYKYSSVTGVISKTKHLRQEIEDYRSIRADSLTLQQLESTIIRDKVNVELMKRLDEDPKSLKIVDLINLKKSLATESKFTSEQEKIEAGMSPSGSKNFFAVILAQGEDDRKLGIINEVIDI